LLKETKPILHANHFLVKPLVSKRRLHAPQLLEYSNVLPIQNIPNTLIQIHRLLEISKIRFYWVGYFYYFY